MLSNEGWLFLTVVGVMALVAMVQRPQNLPEVVGEVDLERYVGRWYAIAHIPTWFERGCKSGTTATYTLLPDGTIEVVNECYDPKGEKKVARGRAWVPNPKEPGKLKVSFVKFLGHWLFPGNYWILALGPDYSWAVVGEPKRKYGWILSRTPTLPEATLEEIRSILERNGYQWEKFVLIDQSPNIKSQ